MDKENTEIHEILSLLEECGLCPQLCDANVPYFDAGIRAGVPADNGDSICEEYLRLPKEMVENDALVVARVKGGAFRAEGRGWGCVGTIYRPEPFAGQTAFPARLPGAPLSAQPAVRAAGLAARPGHAVEPSAQPPSS